MQVLINFPNHHFFCKDPICQLEVIDGILFKNKTAIGGSSQLWQELELKPSSNFFPVWIGFISYEYAHYLDLPTKVPDGNFPDAAFYLFDKASPFPVPNKNPPCPPLKRGGVFYPSIDRTNFLEKTIQIQEEIRNGDVYQVNLTRQFKLNRPPKNPELFYHQLLKTNPADYTGYLITPEYSIISGSPERLFKLQDNQISTKPIAGTKPNTPGSQTDLTQNPKELAEHAMLVDLLRNDLARICETGTVQVPKPFMVESYKHVHHLVSEVCGQTKAPLGDIIRAIFPGGTITGTPKEASMASIAKHEICPRGPYTGSFGYISSNGFVDFNILIRSLFIGRDYSYFSAGSGLVIDSIPEMEFEETEHKIRQFKNAKLPWD